MKLKSIELWLHGLLGAFISSAAGVIAVMIVDPSTFNLTSGLNKTLEVAAVTGIIGAAGYLKKSPLPPEDDDQPTKP